MLQTAHCLFTAHCLLPTVTAHCYCPLLLPTVYCPLVTPTYLTHPKCNANGIIIKIKLISTENPIPTLLMNGVYFL